ncbi:Rhodanese-like domain-containing protein [Abortiporus biennis]|nr:Rhodanese-like domain-containing protein [Abortiporus biennis]
MPTEQLSSTPSDAPPPVPAWAEHLPRPKSKPALLTADEVASLIRTKTPGKDFVVVDVRKGDFEDHYIQSAINLPAQSFHQTLPTLRVILQKIPVVIFYCGSSNGRGPRCAAWYQDALDEAGVDRTESEAKVLEGGIKGWVKKFGEELIVKL